MKVSVVISNYNYARYLPFAVDSALAQTYDNLEIIIVDDGSKDDSREVITKLQQKAPDKIKAIFQPNQGQGAAFNTGFTAATGDIIAFLDADDTWKPHKVQRIVETLSNPELVGVMHSLDSIDSDGNVTDSGDTNGVELSDDLARVIINTGNAWWFPPTSGLAYRRSALEKVLPMDTSKWKICADGCLIYCTAFTGKIRTLHEVLGSYRIHGSNYYYAQQLATEDQQAKWKASMEMTNRYINEFLASINYPERISLSRNLEYQRQQFYWRKKWDTKQVWAISALILSWPYYTGQEKLQFFSRFLIKSLSFIARPLLLTQKTTSI